MRVRYLIWLMILIRTMGTTARAGSTVSAVRTTTADATVESGTGPIRDCRLRAANVTGTTHAAWSTTRHRSHSAGTGLL